MSERHRGEPFSSSVQKKSLAREEWRPAAHAFYARRPDKRRVMEWRRANDTSIKLGYEFEEHAQSINELHGEDFLNDVIPHMIEKMRAVRPGKKVKILDMGCGLGFFNDQIRAKFGDAVEVFGTGIHKSSLKKRKAAIVEDIREGRIEMSPALREQILRETDGTLHPNDAKWNSVEGLSNTPEFDLIIDSEGEITYAGGSGVNFFAKPDSTQDKLLCAIKKLNPGGTLYVSRIHKQHKRLTPERRKQIEANERVTFEDNTKAFHPGALKITKLAK